MIRLFKTARIVALSLALAAGSTGIAVAQQGTGGIGSTGSGTTGTGTTGTGTIHDTRADRGFDWGLLGLVGLMGLIPLFARRDGHVNHSGVTSSRSAGVTH